MTTDGLPLDALAEAAQEPVERVRLWDELGLLPRDGDTFRPDALGRARLISFAVRRGISAEAIARACEDDDVIGRFLDLTAGTEPRPTHTIEEAARAAGVDESVVRRLWVASGLGDQPEGLRRRHRESARPRPRTLCWDAHRRPAAAGSRAQRRAHPGGRSRNSLFHFYVHERLRAEGLTGAELDAATEQVSAPLQEMVEPAVLYFHRKAWQRAMREDMVLHLAEDVAGDDDALVG